MRLLWHILLKDLTRLRIPLVIWSTLQLVAQLGTIVVWESPALASDSIRFLLYTLAGIPRISR